MLLVPTSKSPSKSRPFYPPRNRNHRRHQAKWQHQGPKCKAKAKNEEEPTFKRWTPKSKPWSFKGPKPPVRKPTKAFARLKKHIETGQLQFKTETRFGQGHRPLPVVNWELEVKPSRYPRNGNELWIVKWKISETSTKPGLHGQLRSQKQYQKFPLGQRRNNTLCHTCGPCTGVPRTL